MISAQILNLVHQSNVVTVIDSACQVTEPNVWYSVLDIPYQIWMFRNDGYYVIL